MLQMMILAVRFLGPTFIMHISSWRQRRI